MDESVTHRTVIVRFWIAIRRKGPCQRTRTQCAVLTERVTRTGKVEGDAEGRAQLVVARVALPDRRVGIVDAREDAGLA